MWWGPKSFGMSLETREIKLFGGISRDFAGISRRCANCFRKKASVQFLAAGFQNQLIRRRKTVCTAGQSCVEGLLRRSWPGTSQKLFLFGKSPDTVHVSGSFARGWCRKGRSEIPHCCSNCCHLPLSSRRVREKKAKKRRNKNPPTPSTPTPLRTSQMLGQLLVYVKTTGVIFSTLIDDDRSPVHYSPLRPPTSSLPGECSQAHHQAPSSLLLSTLMDANRRK